MASKLPQWSRDKPPRLSSFGSTLLHITIRLLALIGLLMIAEHVYTSWTSMNGTATRVPHIVRPSHGPIKGRPTNNISSSSSPPSPPPNKAIIAVSMRTDNVSWIHDFFPDWQPNIYVMDDAAAPLSVTQPGGHEASAYLSYIITHYYSLPAHMVFLHARRYQWHNDDVMYDHVPTLRALRLAHVARVGYQSLRCAWAPGCRVSLRPQPGGADGFYEWSAAYAAAWRAFWPDARVPAEVGAPCCAQFAVSRAQVLRRSVREYERVRQWLWGTALDPEKSGRVLEYSWHVLFGQGAVACPSAERCYCEAFGHCNLECADEGSCEGRWIMPRLNERLPENWPAKEAQGQHGWPVDGWWLEGSGVSDDKQVTGNSVGDKMEDENDSGQSASPTVSAAGKTQSF
ncbi:hypothetical protein FH972_025126 [Carpinus fangiana]|uniref:Uncharacterized protein n=1 Tax=Carpinus fangiana TaxID=176857 RepID=A0A5N6L043_9ROSI|nr:hypothetical protein FH972_025126 [Carpinus fangiana]